MTDGHDEDAGPQIAECMNCARSTEHEVLRRTPRGSGVDVLARCIECSKVQTVVIRPPKAVRLVFTLSEGASSKAEEIEVDEDEVLARLEALDLVPANRNAAGQIVAAGAVSALARLRADPDATDSEGATALMVAYLSTPPPIKNLSSKNDKIFVIFE